MITDKLLIDRGYKQMSANKVIWPYAECLFQKRLTDSNGILLFWNVVKYPAIPSHRNKPDYMMEIQNNDPHFTLRLHRIKDIQWAEDMCVAVWDRLGSEYCELFNKQVEEKL